MATHSSILSWEIQRTEEPGGLHPCGLKESDTTEQATHTHTHTHTLNVTFLVQHCYPSSEKAAPVTFL